MIPFFFFGNIQLDFAFWNLFDLDRLFWIAFFLVCRNICTFSMLLALSDISQEQRQTMLIGTRPEAEQADDR